MPTFKDNINNKNLFWPCLTLLDTFCTHYFAVCVVCPVGDGTTCHVSSHPILWYAESLRSAHSFSNQSQASLLALQELTDLSTMATISALITFYRNSQAIERFRSRICSCYELNSLNNLNRHIERNRLCSNLLSAQIVLLGEVSHGSKWLPKLCINSFPTTLGPIVQNCTMT